MRSIHFWALLVGLYSTSCVSYWRGKEISTDIVALQGQVEQLTEEQRVQRERLKKSAANHEKRLMEIDARLKNAISKLQTNSADSGSDIDALKAELARLQGELAKWKHEAGQKAAPDKIIPEVKAKAGAPKLPDTPEEIYRYGYERKKANDCHEANRAFFNLVKRYPKHDRADNSLYLAGQCQFDKNEFSASIRTLRVILVRYKKGKKVDDALELMHDAFLQMGKCKEALVFIQELVSEYPRYGKRRRAKKKLRSTKRKCGKK